ncbi:ABC transporter substrate-binding protein [Lichenihabitans psoromatis]|uniref:ABC transporter substrate-binding protein n=1 Tax=Lichenihabitans psoromatis TaxID=2528642 RepID=UPI0013F16E38|nr:ABC transporter substrate-binding protein [Lichenihabitans psoromatis]
MKRSIRHAVLASTLLAGSGLSLRPAAADPGDIIFARSQDADSLDVARVSTTISFQVMQQIYDNLLNLDDKGKVSGGLAASYTASADNMTFTFTMRPNIKCHDGTTFDAKAAKWNIDRAIDPKTGSSNASSYGSITSTEVNGDVLTVKLSKPYSPLTTFLGSAQALMMCPATIQGSDVKPVGTGPWKFVEWVRNDRLVLARNPAYVNVNPLVDNPGAPYAQRLIFRVIPEGPSRMAALKTGEVTFAEPSLQDAADLAKDKNYTVYTGAGRTGQLAYVGFTAKIPPLNDVRVRRAIGYALDRDSMVDIGFNGLVQASPCPVAPGLLGYDPKKCAEWATAYDPDKAKQLLKEVGYGPDHPLDITLSVSPLQGWDESDVVMQQQLAAVGINVKIEQRQFATWVDYMSGKNKETTGTPAIWTMGMSGPDPDYLVFLFQPPGYAGQGIDDPVLQKMLVDQRALSGAEREAKILDIQKFLLVNAYEVPLFTPGWFWLATSKSTVTGFKQGYNVMPLFNDVKLP